MRSICLLSVVVSVLVITNADANDDDVRFKEIPSTIPASISYDVGGGKDDNTQWDISCTANTIIGKVQIIKAHGNENWVSAASIFVNPFPKPGPNIDPSSEFFALRFLTTFTNTNALARFEKAVGGRITEMHSFSKPMDRARRLSFQIAWDRRGTITATIDRGQTFEFPISKPVTSISFAVSGAQAAFSEVRLGHSGPQNSDCAGNTANN